MVQFSANDDPLDAADKNLPGRRGESFSGKPQCGPFTVESANQMLPLLNCIVTDLMMLSKELDQQRSQIKGLERLPKATNLASFSDELTAIKESFNTDRQRLESCHRELDSLGVQIDSLRDGSIDFPALLDRRPVMLCWQIGESTVAHWHDSEERFPERRQIAGQRFDVEAAAVQRP